MQTHMFEGPRNRPSTVATGECRSQERQDATSVSYRAIVVLGEGIISRAQLINESPEGIGIQIASIGPSTLVGDRIEVIYRGKRCGGEIQHITQQSDGYYLGLQWKKSYAQ